MRGSSFVAVGIALALTAADASAVRADEESGDLLTEIEVYRAAVEAGDDERAARLAFDLYDTALDAILISSPQLCDVAFKLGGPNCWESDDEKVRIGWEDEYGIVITTRGRSAGANDDLRFYFAQYGRNLPRDPGKNHEIVKTAYEIAVNAAEAIRSRYGKKNIIYARAAMLAGQLGLGVDGSKAQRKSRSLLKRAFKAFRKSEDARRVDLARSSFLIGTYHFLQDNYVNLNNPTFDFTDAIEIFGMHPELGQKSALLTHAYMANRYSCGRYEDELADHAIGIGKLLGERPVSSFRPLCWEEPLFTVRALTAAEEGYAIVEVTVAADGSVTDQRVVRASPANFYDTSVLEAVKEYRYAPMVVEGEAVETEGVRIRFKFKREYGGRFPVVN